MSLNLSFTKLVVSVSLGALGLIYLLFQRHKQRLHSKYKLPVISGFSMFFWKDEFKETRKLTEEKGNVFLITFGPLNFVHITSPDIVRSVLKEREENFPKFMFPVPKVMKDLHISNMMMSNGEDWERHRSITKSSFDLDSLKGYVPDFVNIAQRMINNLEKLDLSNEIDMASWVNRAAMDILGETIFGVDFGTVNNQDSEYVTTHNDYMSHISNPLWMVFPFLEDLPLPVSHRMKSTMATIKRILNEMVQEKLEKRKAGIKLEKMSMLDHAIETVFVSDGILTEHELKSDIFIFFAAGHETTAASVSWCIHLLAQHPEIQEKVYEEVSTVLKGRQPTYEDLKNMPYLLRTLKEVMRIEPPVYHVPSRTATEDIEIQEQDCTIPKGTIINFNVRILHHDPKYWTNPEKFDPDRFLPENSKGRHPFCYLPFSLGRRMCIGSQFSVYEQQVLVSMMIQKFKFRVGTIPIKKKLGITNTPVSAYLYLEKR